MENINEILCSIKNSILEFSKEHNEETFYACAIDATLLCLNSEEEFEKTLKKYKTLITEETYDKYDFKYYQENDYTLQQYLEFKNKNIIKRYHNKEGEDYLRYNTGDWKYQGFADFPVSQDLYDDHYNDPRDESEYKILVDKIISHLIENKDLIFGCIKTTPDFRILYAEHDY